MMRSEMTDELAAALAKAQSELAPAKRDRLNPYFHSSYADLASVWDACRVALSSNGLAVSQLVQSHDGASVTVETVLLHSSGQWLASSITLVPTKPDPQGIGSAITYARRYALAAIVGVCSDDDDDGNAASGQAARKTEGPTKAAERGQPPQVQFADVIKLVEKAQSQGDLDAIAARLKRVKLSDEERTSLRDAWLAKSKQLAAAHQAADKEKP